MTNIDKNKVKNNKKIVENKQKWIYNKDRSHMLEFYNIRDRYPAGDYLAALPWKQIKKEDMQNDAFIEMIRMTKVWKKEKKWKKSFPG